MADGHISDAFADILLLAWLTKDDTVLPDSLFVGLTLALPTDNEGTGIIEPDAVEYGRVELVSEVASWDSMGAGSRAMETLVEILFEEAVDDWGQILGYTLHDAVTDGVYLGYGITNPIIITAGMTARLPAGLIVVTMPTT